jgi:hypothetical protein
MRKENCAKYVLVYFISTALDQMSMYTKFRVPPHPIEEKHGTTVTMTIYEKGNKKHTKVMNKKVKKSLPILHIQPRKFRLSPLPTLSLHDHSR